SQEDKRCASKYAGCLADDAQRGPQRLEQQEKQRSARQGNHGPRLPPAHAAEEGEPKQAKGQWDNGQIQPNRIVAQTEGGVRGSVQCSVGSLALEQLSVGAQQDEWIASSLIPREGNLEGRMPVRWDSCARTHAESPVVDVELDLGNRDVGLGRVCE